MNSPFHKRRRFMRLSLAVPLMSSIGWNVPVAMAFSSDQFLVTEKIYHSLFMLYGGDANNISSTDQIQLNVPEIAENGAVVGISVTGAKGLVTSLAIFVEQNPELLISTCKLHAGADLTVSLRVKIDRSSNVFVVARTDNGLIGVMKPVKVTIGCGGG